MAYPAAVLERFDAPAGAGALAPGPGEVVEGRAGDVTAGADVAFRVRITDGRISDLVFRAWGCPYTIAACSLAVEQLAGQPATALRDFGALALSNELELPVARHGRLLVIEDALRSCWAAWDNRGLSASSVSRSDP